MSDEAPVKRLTAKRKSAVVIDIFKGKVTPVEVALQHDFTVAEVEHWVNEAEQSMENRFRTRTKDVREQYEKELQETREAHRGCSFADLRVKKVSAPARRRGKRVRSLQAQLVAEGHHVSLSKLCGWLGVPRRPIY